MAMVAACSASSATPSPASTTRASTPAASSSSSPGGPVVVHVTITNASCVPDRSSVPAGPVTFEVTNDGGDRVSEIELKLDDRILGEKENLVPGLSADFTVTLEPGTYDVECPGADSPSSAFTVTGAAAPSASE
jgi:iron uptake system component EfeO